ncbi:uroporphyrinogen decarboxylase family protein [candidate division KSB1 bacterium]
MKDEVYSSWDRVLAALEHREPDRIPLDLGNTGSSGIMIGPYRDLIQRLGVSEDVEVGDLKQQLAKVSEEVKGRLMVDFRSIDRRSGGGWKPEFKVVDGYRTLIDEWGIGWRMPLDGGFYYDMFSHPLSEASGPADVEKHAWPDPEDPSRIDGMDESAKVFKEDGKAVVAASMTTGIFEMSLWLRGFENFFMDLALNPALAEALLDKILELHIRYWSILLPKLQGNVLVVRAGDDLGCQHGLLISPDMYRKYLKPRHKKLFDFMKSGVGGEGKVFLFLHSCGAIRELIPDLIEVGVDILNPVQVNAPGMDSFGLKRDFGDSITFWGGGVDTQTVLPYGSADEVRDEVKMRIDHLAPGGGFIFAPVHNIQTGVPPENVLAMWETWRDYGQYR